MDGYKDITDVFFQSLRHIDGGIVPDSGGNRVVKSQLFDLLEGARAVEVNNARLDTGMIYDTLTPQETDFDCFKPISESQLIALLNRLFRSLMGWLDNSSLPVTVLSCRYVQEIVQKYTTEVDRGMHKFYLGDALTNKVLKTAVVAVCKFVGIVITISNTVLYEEEDLTTRAMEFNFLNEVLIDEVVEDIDATIELVMHSSLQNKSLIVHQLRLLSSINKLPVLFNLPVDLFASPQQQQQQLRSGFVGICEEGLQSIKYLVGQKAECESKSVPEGSISRYIQAQVSNRNIPGEIYDVSFDETYVQLTKIFTQVKDIFTKACVLSNMRQFNEFVQYDIQLQAHQFHVITRGLFQLFLIRDDQKVMGSAFGLSEISLEMMNYVNLYNCNIVNSKTWNLSNSDTDIVIDKLNAFLKELDVSTYQNLTVHGHNRCRQRQIINKNLLLWDSLQVQAEKLEMELYTSYKIFDKLNDSEDIGLPLSSYVYYTKLELMIDFLLIGMELELYKEYEILTIYWYLNYLLKLIINHVRERVVDFNKHKSQRLAKQKKKSKNKAEIDDKRAMLTDINEYMAHKLQYYEVLQKLVNNVNLLLMYYHNTGVVNLKQTSSEFASNFENLFRLRFKPFESIGVPKLLLFEQYLNSFVPNITKEEVTIGFDNLKSDLQQHAKTCDNENEKTWVNSLIKSCFMYLLELKNDTDGISFTVSTGYNPYFPKFLTK